MIAFQVTLGAILTLIFIASSEKLAAAFVPAAVRQTSLTYVRISSVEALSSAMEVAISSSTRALDSPNVPLLISSTKFLINIILDLLLISKFHVGTAPPTITSQALIRMACDLTSAVCGLLYFLYIASKLSRCDSPSSSPSPTLTPTQESRHASKPRITLTSFKTLARPAIYTFAESALRNSIYLWLISGIVSMGSDYATAWGVFNTIRWGIVMVPVQALEASALTFVGHAWGVWRGRVGAEVRRPKATRRDLVGEFVQLLDVNCSGMVECVANKLMSSRYCASCVDIVLHCAGSRGPVLHLPFAVGHWGVCLLFIRVGCCG